MSSGGSDGIVRGKEFFTNVYTLLSGAPSVFRVYGFSKSRNLGMLKSGSKGEQGGHINVLASRTQDIAEP